MPCLHNNRILASLLATAVLALAASATARPAGDAPPMHGGGPGGAMSENRLEGLVEELELDDATLAAVGEVLQASRERGREFRRGLREARDRMRGLLDASSPDETAIFTQVDVISGLRGDLEKNRLGTLIRVRALLSPEARARLLEAMKKRPSHRRLEGRPSPDRPW